jgi:hypothetical protein
MRVRMRVRLSKSAHLFPLQNDYAEIIRLGEVEKKGPVKWVTRTLVLTDNQLLCMRVRSPCPVVQQTFSFSFSASCCNTHMNV